MSSPESNCQKERVQVTVAAGARLTILSLWGGSDERRRKKRERENISFFIFFYFLKKGTSFFFSCFFLSFGNVFNSQAINHPSSRPPPPPRCWGHSPQPTRYRGARVQGPWVRHHHLLRHQSGRVRLQRQGLGPPPGFWHPRSPTWPHRSSGISLRPWATRWCRKP